MAPRVSVILAVLDEVAHIDEVLDSLTDQADVDDLEIVVADGGSTDGTGDRLRAWSERLPGLRVIGNPGRVQSHGLNLAAQVARGEILVRADGHTTYARDYVRRSVDRLLASDAVAVGGNQRAEGTTPFGRAVAAVMTSALAIGPARFRHADDVREVDTVYLGAYRRADLLAVGGYRHLPSGVAEDADLYHRWRRLGRTVLLDPAIRSTYRPRETVRGFLRQSVRYGRGKAELLWLEGRFPSWRPLAPLALVVGLIGSGVLALAGVTSWPLVGVITAWFGLAAVVALTRSSGQAVRVFAAVVILHLGYGAGLLVGLLRGPGPIRRLRRRDQSLTSP